MDIEVTMNEDISYAGEKFPNQDPRLEKNTRIHTLSTIIKQILKSCIFFQ
jgi:hypothetical protein